MSIKIGREQTGYGGVVTWSENGDEISAQIDYAAPTLAAVKVIRQQLAGYAHNVYERVVPIIDSDDSDRSGWYAIDTVSLSIERPYALGYQLSASVSLRKVAGYQTAIVEQIASGTYRTGIPGAFIAVPWLAWPLSWTGIDPTYSTAPGAYDTRVVTSSPALSVGSYVAADNFDGTYLSEAPLASFYDAAATFYTGSNLDVVVGTQFVDDPANWKIGNGLLEVRNPTSTANLFEIRWRNAAGSSWSAWYALTAAKFPAGVYTQYAATYVRAIPLVRNSPEEVIARLAIPAGPSSPGTLYVTISLRRGSRYLTLLLESNITARWGVAWASATATEYITAHNVGVRQDADNADTNRNLLASGSTVSFALSTGRMGLTANGTMMDAFVGCEVGGSGGATAIDTAVYEQARYFAAVSERQSVIPQ